MPRAIKHAWAIGHVLQMCVNAIHVLPGEQKGDENERPEDQMEAFHACGVYGNRGIWAKDIETLPR